MYCAFLTVSGVFLCVQNRVSYKILLREFHEIVTKNKK